MFTAGAVALSIKGKQRSGLDGAIQQSRCSNVITPDAGCPQPVQRQLAALGLGYLREPSRSRVRPADRRPLAWGQPGSSAGVGRHRRPTGMETVAYTLLHGDERLRKAAAQALTNNPEEGYPPCRMAAPWKTLAYAEPLFMVWDACASPGPLKSSKKWPLRIPNGWYRMPRHQMLHTIKPTSTFGLARCRRLYRPPG